MLRIVTSTGVSSLVTVSKFQPMSWIRSTVVLWYSRLFSRYNDPKTDGFAVVPILKKAMLFAFSNSKTELWKRIEPIPTVVFDV